MNLSKWEKNKVVNRRCHSDPAVAGEESQTVSVARPTNTSLRCFALLHMTGSNENETSGGQVRLSHVRSSISAIGRSWRIRRLICRFLLAGFCFGLLQRFLGFSLNRLGSLFRL